MSAEFDLTANVTIRGRNIANSERGDPRALKAHPDQLAKMAI